MAEAMAVDVAKKRAKASHKEEAESPGRKPVVAQVRGNPAWKAWVEKMAHYDNRSVASLFERAIHRYAKEIGFPDEAPER